MKIKVLKFFFEKLSRVYCRPRKYVKSVMTFQSCRTFFKTRHFTCCKIGMRNLPRKVFKLLQIESGIPNHGGRFNIQRLNQFVSYISLAQQSSYYCKKQKCLYYLDYCNVLKGNHNTYKNENNKCCSKLYCYYHNIFCKCSCLV